MFDHTKTNDTELLIQQASALLESETDFIANCANLSSLIFNNIEGLNWVGFYLLKEDELVLGPFQGLSACTRIQLGKGVCGTSVLNKQTLNIQDVHLFPGHIACDSASNSECVVPLIKDDKVIGVFDVDSPILNRFDLSLQNFFEAIVKLLIEKSKL